MTLRVAVVSSGFEPEHPGGVTNVAIRLIELLKEEFKTEITVISFANSRKAKNSIQFFWPPTYRNKLIVRDLKFKSHKMISIGTFGSEFEFLRYRKRRKLEKLFSQFDIIIVVTGFLQFANVIPKVSAPVLVQCATRLVWERSSQYREMSFIRKWVLHAQHPAFKLQEIRVLSQVKFFILENQRMINWIKSHSNAKSCLWYPTTFKKANELEGKGQNRMRSHFVSVGRLNEARKGWGRLLESYFLAFQSNSNLPKLVIIGWGDFSIADYAIFERVKEFCPIILLRNVDNDMRDQYVSNASFFLQSSFEEGLGLAALEALSCGIPLVCSETDGSIEYLENGQNGFLVAQGKDFESRFAKAILDSQGVDYLTQSNRSFNLYRDRFGSSVNDSRLFSLLRGLEPQ